MSSGGVRASIPSSVRKTIQNIKEITGNHSDEDIYAMLKDCSMDPNETADKLLLQDTFHEVKRKKDRRKENLNNRESVESRWRPGNQGRGVRGGRMNFSPHHGSHDAGGKNSGVGKDNGTNQVLEKSAPTLTASQETKTKERSLGTSSVLFSANGPTTVASGTTSAVHPSHSSAGSGDGMGTSSGGSNHLGSALPSDISSKGTAITFGSSSTPNLSNSSGSKPMSASTVCFSTSDLVLVQTNDFRTPGAAGAIRHEVGGQGPPSESNAVNTADNKSTAASEISSSSVQGKNPGKSQCLSKNHYTELSPPSSTIAHGSSSASRPSSNYSSRSQPLIGPQKAGSNKEWKPKPTSTVNQGSVSSSTSEAPAALVEGTSQLQSVSSDHKNDEATSKLQKKLEDLRLPQRQHVILPNHIYVPNSEKTKFSFGSLGTSFGVNTGYASGAESERSSTLLSETSENVEETTEEHASSQNTLVTAEVRDYPDHPQSPTNVPENLSSGEVNVSSSATQVYNESKQESALPSGGHQYPVVHNSPNYSFGFVPPMLGTQLAPFDNSESQARDISRLQSFVVHQPFDPTSYYAQFYRSGADIDGRISPFPSAGVATKYNGNVTVLPAPNSQSPQEGGVLSTAGPTPVVTQAAGLMQSSIPVTQQPVPVFRPPTGVHISHYPPNFIPYTHYISPFYVPPPGIHQFMGNGAFPQQPQASTVYPPPPAPAATGVKYPLPQYKPGTNAANPAPIVMPSAYGAYGSSPAGYNPSSAANAGNSTSSEDLGPSQFKESNVYINGQQSEGSAVWVATPGRDISSLPASSFYNLPPQGQHVTFAPTQAGHSTFPGIYHPAQAVTGATVHPLLQQSQTMAGAVDMVGGPGGSVYQQPQHTQINWSNNY